MTVYITEHVTNNQPGVLSRPVAAYGLTSASTAAFPAGGVQLIRAVADAGSYLNLFGSTVALTSTNSLRLAPNVPELFAVSTSAKIVAAST